MDETGDSGSLRRLGLALILVAVSVVSCHDARLTPPSAGDAVALRFAKFLLDRPDLELIRLDVEPDAPRSRLSSPRRIVLGEGWSRTEDWGTWAVGDRSTFQFIADQSGARTLYVEARPFVDTRDGRQQRITVTLNDEETGNWELERGWQSYRLEVSRGALRSGINQVRLDYAYSLSPRELGNSEDPRKLSAGFRRIALLDSGAGRPEEGRGPGSLFVPMLYPARASNVEVELAANRPRDWPPGLDWYWQGLDGSTFGAQPFSREPGSGDTPDVVYAGPLPAGRSAGVPGCLTLQQGPGLSPPRAELAALRLSSAGTPSTPASAADPSKDPAELPDIVVILLDAARADHFGAYGYSRPTTPNIDGLAAESLVFDQVYATASYTLSSIPTMLTGMAFVDHGVQVKGDVLDPSARTLPEYLQAGGYRTVCYSANANNSVAKGSDQGCEEFVEVWRGAARRDWLEPDWITDRAIARLNRGFGDQPLFMFLHYVPPHEPYIPGPQFDVFGDAGYRGDASGDLAVLQAIERGALETRESSAGDVIHSTPADMARVVSLYDGNLLKADHSVGRLLERLRQRPRWRDTAVLVVSDHGEAFLEHGRMGHNSTVYDEMLHVPFILRLPGNTAPPEVDTSVLASLEDLTPTLLGLAGIVPGPAVVGRDLLSDQAETPRAVVSRSAGESPTYAYRTADWKAMFGARGAVSWSLFDLNGDPRETKNRALEQLELLTCTGALLEWRLTPTADLLPAGQEILDEADLEALRALGYVQ